MKLGTGKIVEIRQTGTDSYQAVIQLAGVSIPHPGQYLQVHHPVDDSHAAGLSLFPGGLPDKEQDTDCFTTASTVPAHWSPGDFLRVRGPLGKGFRLPEDSKRLALIALSDQGDHVLPLAAVMLAKQGEVAMFIKSDPVSLPPHLPARIEINRLGQLKEGLRWADFAAFSIFLDEYSSASEILARYSPLGVQGQMMIFGQMPCAGMADCGICSVRMPNGRTRLVCKYGPVLEI